MLVSSKNSIILNVDREVCQFGVLLCFHLNPHLHSCPEISFHFQCDFWKEPPFLWELVSLWYQLSLLFIALSKNQSVPWRYYDHWSLSCKSLPLTSLLPMAQLFWLLLILWLWYSTVFCSLNVTSLNCIILFFNSHWCQLFSLRTFCFLFYDFKWLPQSSFPMPSASL